MRYLSHQASKIAGITLLSLLLFYGIHIGVKTSTKTKEPEKTVAGQLKATAEPKNDSPSNLDNATQKYLSLLQEDTSVENMLDKQRLEAFMAQNSDVLLPSVAPNSIRTIEETDHNAIQNYLTAISSTHNPSITAIKSSQIEEAYYLHSRTNNPEKLHYIINELNQNIASLKEIEVPVNVLDTHIKLTAATQALFNNVKMLTNIEEDFVGSLIAAQNIEQLGSVFEELAEEIAILKAE